MSDYDHPAKCEFCPEPAEYWDDAAGVWRCPDHARAKAASGLPACNACGAAGHGVQFSIFSPHGFGTFCVPCEAKIDAARGAT